jgi:hypothetical protein
VFQKLISPYRFVPHATSPACLLACYCSITHYPVINFSIIIHIHAFLKCNNLTPGWRCKCWREEGFIFALYEHFPLTLLTPSAFFFCQSEQIIRTAFHRCSWRSVWKWAKENKKPWQLYTSIMIIWNMRETLLLCIWNFIYLLPIPKLYVAYCFLRNVCHLHSSNYSLTAGSEYADVFQ